jgi:hypothetical protein
MAIVRDGGTSAIGSRDELSVAFKKAALRLEIHFFFDMHRGFDWFFTFHGRSGRSANVAPAMPLADWQQHRELCMTNPQNTIHGMLTKLRLRVACRRFVLHALHQTSLVPIIHTQSHIHDPHAYGRRL